MAIIKHIANKNANYREAIDYMKYEYDEHSQKPLPDKFGNLRLRDEFILEGINCNPETFDIECKKLNKSYNKNQRYDEIKSHHYIISFDPLDQIDNGFTKEKAQALGMEFTRKHFPGHQAIVCTHTDGHNGSGNIHIHIVINSLRKFDVAPQDFMERPCDSRAGCKHHLTKDYLICLKKSLMEMCIRENLNQVDLLTDSEAKISEQEYWAAHRGQEKLDKLNDEITANGLTPMETKFQTQKQFLRDAIDDISSYATSPEMFREELQKNYHISLTESRGRYSYLHPDRSKNITGRALGTRYEKEFLLARFEENIKLAEILQHEQLTNAENRNNKKETLREDMPKTATNEKDIFAESNGRRSTIYDSSYDYENDPVAILYIHSHLRLVVNLQERTKAKLSHAYAQKVKISNLKEMARTIAYVQEHGIDSRENLRSLYHESTEKMNASRQALHSTEKQIQEINQQIHYTGQYLSNKSIYGQMLASRSKKNFRTEHASEISKYEEAVQFLKSQYPDGSFPSIKSLKEEREKLSAQKGAASSAYNNYKYYRKDLQIICTNVDSILGHGKTLQAEQSTSI